MKIFNTCNYTVDAVGAGYGLANIQTILGIVVLIFTILNVLINTTVKIIIAVKKREYDKISEVLDETKEQLEEVSNNEKSK